MTAPPITQPDHDAKRLAALHQETYADWIARFCRERKIPWREEYAIPMDERPVSAARQDRALAAVARKGAAA